MDAKENRTLWKRNGKRVLSRHYLMLMFLCLILSLFGTEAGLSKAFLEIKTEEYNASEDASILDKSEVFTDILNGNFRAGEKKSEQIQEQIQTNSANAAVLGRNSGVLAALLNAANSGKLDLISVKLLRNLTKTNQGAAKLFSVLELLRVALIWIFLRNIYSAVIRRMFLEARTYDKLPFLDTLHIAAFRRWLRASLTMLLKAILHALWSLTVVGYFIKHYSYFCVPYIVAENPDIRPNEALTLSRRMMDGHKAEAFLFDLSYLGWILLGIVTFGISDLLYGYPYRLAGRTEYYAWLRQQAINKQIPGTEYLNDVFLYEKADKITLYEKYFDVVDKQAYIHENEIHLTGRQAFFSKWLRIWIGSLKNKQQYEEQEGLRYELSHDQLMRDGKAYPVRLHPLYREDHFHLKKSPFTFLRSYSVWSLILLFILFCIIGWTWEVSLCLMRGEGFVNRGMLHGPWLPIYETGGIIALILCSSFRRYPVKEFFFSVALCGVIEYLGAWYLETRYHEQWWSYAGHFLNLHGRICAEGLIVFGIACMLIVYLIAPLFDYLISKIPKRILVSLACCLLGLFLVDTAYSSAHPNTVKGAVVSGHNSEKEGQA